MGNFYIGTQKPSGIYIGTTKVTSLYFGTEKAWSGEPVVIPNYLCFTAEQANSTISMSVNGTSTKSQALEYSTNGTTWDSFVMGTTTVTLANVGDKVYFRGDNTTISESTKIYYKFVMTGRIAGSGNIMSLLDKTLASTTIGTSYCFYSLFAGCTALTSAPELPATTLATYCYNLLFSGCTALSYIKLGYTGTFSAVSNAFTSWVQNVAADGNIEYNGTDTTVGVNAIPSNWRVNGKHRLSVPTATSPSYTGSSVTPTWTNYDTTKMSISGDTSGIEVGSYTAVFTLADTDSYTWRDGTTAPKSVPWSISRGKLTIPSAGELYYTGAVLTPNWVGYDSTKMTIGGTTSGTEIGTYTATFTLTDTTHYMWSDRTTAVKSVSWTIVEMRDFLCFTAEEANSCFCLNVTGTPTKSQAFEYSTDGNTWISLPIGTYITLSNVGDKAYLRGNNTTVSESSNIYYRFNMTGKIAASGNIMSLVDTTCTSTTIPSTYCFTKLFEYCTALTSAPELPATTLKSYCYRGMFSGCTSILIAPELPATSLPICCYQNMFEVCRSLICIKINYTGTFISAASNNVFKNWVNNVAASGDFYYNGADTTTGVDAIPSGWTVHTF